MLYKGKDESLELLPIRERLSSYLPKGSKLGANAWQRWKRAAKIKPQARRVLPSDDPMNDLVYRLEVCCYLSKHKEKITVENVDVFINEHGKISLEDLGLTLKSTHKPIKPSLGSELLKVFAEYTQTIGNDATLSRYCQRLFNEKFSRKRLYEVEEIQEILKLYGEIHGKPKIGWQTLNAEKIT